MQTSLFSQFRIAAHSQRYARRGLTLIELITVISVIAILSAILIAAIGSGRSKANTVKCAANLRAIHSGLMLLVNENNNLLPATASVNQQNYQWRADAPDIAPDAQISLLSWRLKEYGVDPKAFECPSALITVPPAPAHWHYRRLHWVMRQGGSGPADRFYPFRDGLSVLTLHEQLNMQPSNVILLYDFHRVHGSNDEEQNFLYLDGSVRTLLISDTGFGTDWG